MNKILTYTLAVSIGLSGSVAAAQTLQIPNTFQASTPAHADEVNENFDAVANSVNSNAADIASNSAIVSINTTNILNNASNIEANAVAIAVVADEVSSFGTRNIRGGTNALHHNTTGSDNSAYGVDALANNTAGGTNTAIGSGALFGNTTGNGNTATGYDALRSNDAGFGNTANGIVVLRNNINGIFNTGIGDRALRFNTFGSRNTASGFQALFNNTTGNRNIAVGNLAGQNYTTGSDNIAIGNEGNSGESATIRIGNSVAGSAQTRTFFAGISGVMTGINDAVPVLIDSAGQLGTTNSSRRYKEDIEDMAGASDDLLSLRPVTFRYKNAFEDGDKPIQYGLIAEEVAEVFPDLVVHNEDSEAETVKYHLLATLLLNELQKQHRVIEEQAQKLSALDGVITRLARLEAELSSTVVIAAEQ